jgi:hypothetical protein
MVTVSQITQKLINDNLLYQETILIGITNYTSLAKLLKPDVEKIYRNKVKLSTITRAIQRYAEITHEKHKLSKVFFFKGIKLDSNVIYFVVNESAKVMDKIRRAYDEIEFQKGHIFNILHGNCEIAIITNKEYKETILGILFDEKISHIVEDHDSITLTYSKDYTLTPGVIYGVSRYIAWEKINVLTWIHTPQELTLIVHDNDATKCYDILRRMQKKQRENALNSSPIKEQIVR